MCILFIPSQDGFITMIGCCWERKNSCLSLSGKSTRSHKEHCTDAQKALKEGIVSINTDLSSVVLARSYMA